ncbi:MAG: fumarylacetoacetate hydrolase [Alteromonadaceae bacterium]|uniref:fumarylacetoacetate hydrolase family protein n=1 Tax=Paraglaciecola chathamensis TaxID=368405 RepID=UPI000C603913|nr:fumarylacetoacetate hydrolase family protein [Paraglaciecola agarilytica]MBN27814.1 fumarylacetoacetate hydrolase [Alteromonadaceae bacterium]|tara:strand:- start:23564 stop:24544 length:981 start_codon:yes stop_codon:yes gene_type:complete
MKLATLKNGSKDGSLHIVSRDLCFAVSANDIAPTLQYALENWHQVEGPLTDRFEALQKGSLVDAFAFDHNQALAPLPRAWQWLDGSAFDCHGELMDKVFGMKPMDRQGRPLMYQGVSNKFYAPTEAALFTTEDEFIDFEGEFGVIVDETPMGIGAVDAAQHIRLVVQINDWSLRKLAPIEMKTGFGWVQAKPPCAMAPVAVTPDELGENWRNSRVALDLQVKWNDKQFGAANGEPMSCGFNELVEHAAHSRTLVAGTVIGSGTVSNANYREIGSSCIAERRGIELMDEGEAKTGFMKFGDTVHMEVFDPSGQSVFGAIKQEVIKAK